ncbi:hypothetical protein PRIPAC_98052 [Pristionchus pacificus]|uniref:Uncharacterized protein n=1 Tax=Pristionchus pacificus TaxID=54126 RepID=A0A2A6BDI3_PRIPA|nr:hypothetical protein PRIPAC_98052 [Pristionchus pacificus]|eukprot:PDM63955.1 hypothetical protein PRIPAC_49456 [Pristionchus pacificus]
MFFPISHPTPSSYPPLSPSSKVHPNPSGTEITLLLDNFFFFTKSILVKENDSPFFREVSNSQTTSSSSSYMYTKYHPLLLPRYKAHPLSSLRFTMLTAECFRSNACPLGNNTSLNIQRSSVQESMFSSGLTSSYSSNNSSSMFGQCQFTSFS